MTASPPPESPEEVLVERMRILYAQLRDAHRHSAKYKRLTAEIRELSVAYRELIEAKKRMEGSEPKP
jgi:hypothetical protein